MRALKIKLTERDKLLLDALVESDTMEDIARMTGLVNGSVRVFMYYLRKKIGVKSSMAAAIWWMRRREAEKAALEKKAPHNRRKGDKKK